MKNGKVVLVGTGFVGMSMAYSILNRGGVSELILIDIDKDKTIGEEMDLSHGLPFAPQKMIIKAGDYDECKDAQVVVITAGIAQKPGQTRLELAETNTKIMKGITQNIMASGFDGIIVVASNPVDLMTYVVAKVSGLPKNKVIGSGTVLDTARLRYLVSDYLKVSSKNIHAYIMGEHGDSSFVPWDHTYVGCKRMKDVMKDNGYPLEDLDKIHKDVVQAAYEIINKKETRKYKNMSAKYLYQLPQLKGNSAAIKKINKSLRADYKKTLSGKESLFEYFEGDKYNSFRQDYGEKYYDTVTCKVMFNQNGYISFRYSCKWYAGGVGNVWEYGLTYRLKDGKKMGIQDVLAGSRDSAKQRIASTYANKISSRGYEPIMKMKYSEFCFYIKPGKKVVVCFGPYQPMGGNGKSSITMKGKIN